MNDPDVVHIPSGGQYHPISPGAPFRRGLKRCNQAFAARSDTPSTMTDLLRIVPMLCCVWLALIGLVPPRLADAGEINASSRVSPRAIAIFGGLLTNNHWEDAFAPWTLDFSDSTLVGLAASHGIGRFDHRLGFEIEGQVVRHFGDQDHWEINLPVIGRWELFPWDEVVDTSLAFGIGPSYASEKPKVEVANDGDSRRLLVYWMMEIEVGPPDKSWSAIFRLHHRSGAFGLFAEEGGSNAMVIGLRHMF